MLQCNVSSIRTNFRSLEMVPAISRWSWMLVSPVLYVFGIFGNVMIFVIFRRIRTGTSAVFFTVLAASDLCLLNSGLLVHWIEMVFSTSLTDLSNASCKLLQYFRYVAGSLSVWLLVAMTTQRAVSVVWPHRVSSLYTRRHSTLLVVGVVVVVLLLHVHLLYGYGLVESVNSTTSSLCFEMSLEYCLFLYYVWSWIDLLAFSLLPFVLLLVSNVVLVWKMKASFVEARQMTGMSTDLNNLRTKVTSSITVTLVFASATFCILSLPICVFLIVLSYSDIEDYDPIVYIDWNYGGFVHCVVSLLWYTNSTVNFYIYCLTGTKFRDECKKIMFSCKERSSSHEKSAASGRVTDKIRSRI